jgi:hypothetical protein
MAISPNVDFVAGQILTATQQNQFPRGVMALATVASNYAPTAVISDFASLTFTAVANRYYRYSVYIPGADSSAAITLTATLTDSAGSTTYNSFTQSLRGAALLDSFTFVTIRAETAGSITRKIRMVTSAGNASMCSNTSIGYFVVEDLGPA